jgi:hypothetical protein
MGRVKIEDLFRAFGQALGEAMAENGKFRFERDSEEDWDGFEELRLIQASPTKIKVALGRADVVRVSEGEKLAVSVEGGKEAEAALRFRVSEDTIKIARRSGASREPLQIAVTMPAPETIAVGGAGTVEADGVASEATLAIGGSGTIRITAVAGESLDARIGGSGRIELSGAVRELAVKIGGSGTFEAPGLEVDTARIGIGGSGKAELSSDGEVDAKIGGSGDILVHGNARCSLRAGGSGRLRCVPREMAA